MPSVTIREAVAGARRCVAVRGGGGRVDAAWLRPITAELGGNGPGCRALPRACLIGGSRKPPAIREADILVSSDSETEAKIGVTATLAHIGAVAAAGAVVASRGAVAIAIAAQRWRGMPATRSSRIGSDDRCAPCACPRGAARTWRPVAVGAHRRCGGRTKGVRHSRAEWRQWGTNRRSGDQDRSTALGRDATFIASAGNALPSTVRQYGPTSGRAGDAEAARAGLSRNASPSSFLYRDEVMLPKKDSEGR
jgi:hypothetical protein